MSRVRTPVTHGLLPVSSKVEVPHCRARRARGEGSTYLNYFQRVVIAKPDISSTKPMARFHVPIPGTGYFELDR